MTEVAEEFFIKINANTAILVLKHPPINLAADGFFTNAELREAEKFQNAHRREEWLGGRYAIKELMHRCYGCEQQTVSLEYKQDRPVLRKLSHLEFLPSVSLSHKKNIVAAAVSRFAIGVDVETLPESPEAVRAIRRACSPRELEVAKQQTHVSESDYLVMLWCLKESLVKAGCIETVFASRNFDLELEINQSGKEKNSSNFNLKTLPEHIGFAGVWLQNECFVAVVNGK